MLVICYLQLNITKAFGNLQTNEFLLILWSKYIKYKFGIMKILNLNNKGCAAFFQDLVNYIYDEYIKELEKIAR